MEVDTLYYTIGGVLSIECEDRRQRPVTFLSKSLNETERNYKIHNKEMLAVIRELENQRHLLEGAKYKFKVWTGHKNLEYFMKVQKLNREQVCWILYLSRFNFTLNICQEQKQKRQIDLLDNQTGKQAQKRTMKIKYLLRTVDFIFYIK